MDERIYIRPTDKVGLELSEVERKLLLDLSLDDHLDRPIRRTPPGQTIPFTLDDLDELGGYVAADANPTENKKRQKQLDRIFE